MTDSYDDTDIFDFFKKFDPNNNEFTQTMIFLNNMNDSVNISYESLIKMFPNLEEYLSLTISKKIPSLDVNLENTTLIKDLYNYLLEKPKESGSLINILSSENSISKLRMLLEKIIKLNKKIDLSNETLTKSFPNLNQVLGKMLDDYFQSTDYTFSYNEKGMQDLWNGLITNNENNQLIKGIYSLFPNIQNEIYEQVGINKDDVFKYLNNICNDLPEFIYLIEEIMEEVQNLNDSFEEFNNAGFFEKFGYIGNVSEKGYYSLTSTMELFDFLGVGSFDIFQVVANLKFKEIPLIGPYLVKSLDKTEDNYEFLSAVGTIAVKKIENFFANLI